MAILQFDLNNSVKLGIFCCGYEKIISRFVHDEENRMVATCISISYSLYIVLLHLDNVCYKYPHKRTRLFKIVNTSCLTYF